MFGVLNYSIFGVSESEFFGVPDRFGIICYSWRTLKADANIWALNSNDLQKHFSLFLYLQIFFGHTNGFLGKRRFFIICMFRTKEIVKNNKLRHYKIFFSGLSAPWFLYKMVTQNLLRRHEGTYSEKKMRIVTALHLIKWFYVTCTSISELPSNISTMIGAFFESFL